MRARSRSAWSGLTVRGRCLLAGGLATAVCAVLLDERDLLRVGLFACLLPLLSWLLALRSRRSVQAARTLAPERVGAGLPVQVRLTLTGGPVLGALRLVDTVPDAAGPDSAAPARFTVHRIGAQGARLSYPLLPRLRGARSIGPLTGRVAGALGLSEFTWELAGPDRLLVHPHVATLHGAPRALGSGDGNPGAVAHQGQGSPDILVRAYRRGDELRRVHWRSTARHDELMVRMEEQPWHAGVTVLLDRRDGAHAGHGATASLEFAVTMAASIALHLMRRGEPVEVVAEDGTLLGGHRGQATASPAVSQALLDALALLRPVARTELGGPALAADADVVAVLGATTAAQAQALAARHPGGGYALLLDTGSFAAAGAAGPGPEEAAFDGSAAQVLHGLGWHLTVVTAGTTPEQAWANLVDGSLGGPLPQQGASARGAAR